MCQTALPGTTLGFMATLPALVHCYHTMYTIPQTSGLNNRNGLSHSSGTISLLGMGSRRKWECERAKKNACGKSPMVFFLKGHKFHHKVSIFISPNILLAKGHIFTLRGSGLSTWNSEMHNSIHRSYHFINREDRQVLGRLLQCSYFWPAISLGSTFFQESHLLTDAKEMLDPKELGQA